MHLTRTQVAGQQSSSSADAATQTEFVPVLVPLRLLRGPPATEASHPEVYEYCERRNQLGLRECLTSACHNR